MESACAVGFFKDILTVTCMCVCQAHADTGGSQDRVLDPLAPGLEKATSHHIGYGEPDSSSTRGSIWVLSNPLCWLCVTAVLSLASSLCMECV